MALKQGRVYCCTSPFINTLAAAGLAKATLCSPKLYSALTPAKPKQWLAAGVSAAVYCTDSDHPMLAVAFILPMSLQSNCICFMFYLYQTKFLNYWPSIQSFPFSVSVWMYLSFGCSCMESENFCAGAIVKYNDPLAFHSRQNLACNTALGAEGKSRSWKSDLAVLHSWKRCLCITHTACH